MLRKVISALILVPLGLVLIALAVANRGAVVVSLDPFDQARPALSYSLPLFVLILLLLIAGVIVGGIASWLRQSKWRRAARQAQAQTRALRAELDAMKEQRGEKAGRSTTSLPAVRKPQLTIPPPAA
jgi:uncharacterized integral membrane protein